MHALMPACLLDHLLAPTPPLIPPGAMQDLDWMLGTARHPSQHPTMRHECMHATHMIPPCAMLACPSCMQDLEALDWMLGTARALHHLHTQLPFGAVVHRVGAAGGTGEMGGQASPQVGIASVSSASVTLIAPRRMSSWTTFCSAADQTKVEGSTEKAEGGAAAWSPDSPTLACTW